MKEGDRPRADVLVLFAFDNTLVDADSNVHIANELDAELATAVKVDNVDRPKAMDEFLLQLAKQRPQVSSVDICNAAQRLPVNQPIVDAIRLAVGDFGATCKIVSDSTVFGVQSFLDHHGLTDRVSEVVANPTHFEDGGKVLRVRPYQGDHLPPHGCSTCPGNLCKGQVLERILQQHRYSRVLYVGAGSEDFCPATKLGRNDVVFARAGETYELLPMLSGSPDKVRAHVLQWKSGGDIPAYFRNFFHRQYPGSCVSNALDIADDGGRFEVPRAVAQRHGKLLVIYDFNDSLVNEDSDTFAIQCFHPELLKSLESRHALKPIWPTVFDDMLQIMDAELPEVTPEVICKRVAEIPIQKRMVDAVRMAVEQFGADVKIISDGNSLYIESVLKHQGLAPYINEVFTNPAEHEVMDNGRIRIRLRPFHPDHLDPIKCQWCPSNLCKGSILDSIRNANPYSRVVYVGDGPGDFCPASRLTKDDVVLARSHLLHGKPYGLQKRINENPGVVQAPVVPWSTGYDIYRRFAQFCQQPYNIPRSTPRISGSVLVVFDYDWSLVNDNSDTFVFQQLYPELLATLRDRRAKQPSWTKIMDDMLGALAEDKPDITPDMIRDTVARVPILPHMLDALRLAKELYNADVKIISDANSVYIESMLQHHGLTQDVSEVITNPASFESLENGRSRLRVRPYHGEGCEPHGCEWCPTNMCKGRIVETLRNAHPYTSVLYVGDGSGDFCAATRLTKNDVMFARADEAEGRSYGLQKRLDENSKLVQASVVPWSAGDDIYRHFAQFFHSPLI